MTEKTFNTILKLIKLPIGEEIKPGIIKTSGTEIVNNIKDRWKDKIEKYQYTIENFDRIYILTGKDKIVGGVLLYGNVDMQIYIFPEYRKKGYASRFMKEKEIFKGQDATIEMDAVKNEDDLDMKCHLFRLADMTPRNIAMVLNLKNEYKKERVRQYETEQRYWERDAI